MGGGVQFGEITEFYGVPGVGKTQFGTQLACTVQIPSLFGGPQKQAIYIDTEGSFMPERAEDIAKALVKHIQTFSTSKSNPPKFDASQLAQTLDGFSCESILSNIIVFRVFDYIELCATIKYLFDFLQNPLLNIGLVVIDSIAFPFRGEQPVFALKQKLLQNISLELTQLASKYEFAIVIMNQVTAKIDFSSAGQKSQLIPALGDNWSHACSTRVMLTYANEQRCAKLVKSSFLKEASAEFEISQIGIRKVSNKRKAQAMSNSLDESQPHLSKPSSLESE